MIQPVLMGGLVKEVIKDRIKVHLHGRLGVITVPKNIVLNDSSVCSGQKEPVPGHEMEFYFSYFDVSENPYEHDASAIKNAIFTPCFISGVITEVNDTAIKAELMDNLGTAAVPRRWVFTDVELQTGQTVEFYFSPMKIVGKKDIPVESI